jgi:predicted Fe-S protein YdhL (DUF1289 family)
MKKTISAETPVESPCIGVCHIPEDQHCCVGCYRSLAEIVDWKDMTDAAKMKVIAATCKRRDAVAGLEGGQDI